MSAKQVLYNTAILTVRFGEIRNETSADIADRLEFNSFIIIFFNLHIYNLPTPGCRVLSKCCGESSMCRE